MRHKYTKDNLDRKYIEEKVTLQLTFCWSFVGSWTLEHFSALQCAGLPDAFPFVAVMSLWGEDACAGKSPTMHVYLEHLLGRQSRTTSYARDTRVITLPPIASPLLFESTESVLRLALILWS
jgi:hypothetical protein